MALGTIKKLLVDKHCGFISPSADGPDVFFHGSVLAGSEFRALAPDQRVEYEVDTQSEIADGDRGPRAVRVRLLNTDQPAAAPQQGEFRQLRRHRSSRAKKPSWRR
jgi:cold shock CspA family protein